MVLVINLAENVGRWNAFCDKYQSSDFARLAYSRLDAVDGKRINWAQHVSPEALEKLMVVQKTGLRQHHPDLTPGAVGCYLSHVKAWRRIAESGNAYGIVFEDDAAIPATAWRHFTTHKARVPSDWDIILLGYEGDGDRLRSDVLRMHHFLRLHAYAITARAARALCETIMPIRQQIDWELNDYMKQGTLQVYGVYPSLVKVAWQGTDIQTPLA
jgi:glycosyl transferase family 25